MATNKKVPHEITPAPQARAQIGTSKAAAAHRKILYANAFLGNNGNKIQAALTAGYKPGRAAEKAGQRLSQDVTVQALIAEGYRKATAAAGLSVERTLLEISRIAYSDPRNLYDEEGCLLPIDALDDEVAATLASIEIEKGAVKKLKLWDKNSALEKAMKFHGLYREDNDQTRPVIVNSINYASLHKPNGK